MSKQKLLSIIIPCYNEEKTINDILREIEAVKLPGFQKELVIVDDGSTDKTRQILKNLKDKNVKVFLQKKNMGKGAAVRRGILESKGDYVIIQDADLEYDPQDYLKLLYPVTRGSADVVYGSRFRGGDPHRAIYFRHQVANKMLTGFSNIFTGLNLTDMETCYKLFDGDLIRDIAKSLQSNRFGFEPEVTAKVAKRKVRIYEVGISYYGRSYAEGKKIGWKDGVKAVFSIVKYNTYSK